ncbi:fimbrial protein [Variovorax sp. J22P271]|uniref:fimbrial protein n=1 Tax=Variovorax davisae TaxID=3053515 RepID=UPI002577DD39|nr:fimbrial protein [Variovorax sp. J22P271]MDM0031934.1 fimbrial protein [Variovorax sp. J22P271]
MKKTTPQFLAALAVAGTALVSQLASAADNGDGTITFKGNITAQTCTINGNGSGAKDFTVTLPTVAVTTLSTAGQTAGRTPFTIALTNCTPDSGNARAYFEPGVTTDGVTGNLKLDAGGATNVQIGLLNGDLTEIKAGFAEASQNSKSAPISAGSATLPYFAQYVSTGTATAGAADSSVMYTIVYQ